MDKEIEKQLDIWLGPLKESVYRDPLLTLRVAVLKGISLALFLPEGAQYVLLHTGAPYVFAATASQSALTDEEGLVGKELSVGVRQLLEDGETYPVAMQDEFAPLSRN